MRYGFADNNLRSKYFYGFIGVCLLAWALILSACGGGGGSADRAHSGYGRLVLKLRDNGVDSAAMAKGYINKLEFSFYDGSNGDQGIHFFDRTIDNIAEGEDTVVIDEIPAPQEYFITVNIYNSEYEGVYANPVYYASVVPDESAEAVPVSDPDPTPEPVVEHRYEIVRANVSWVTAQDQCLGKGGYLAVINSRAEFDKITALADEQGIEFLWIGCHRDVNSNRMVWERDEKIDSSVDPDNNRMSLWARGEPSYIDGDGSSEDYISLWNHDGGWSYWDSRNDLHNLWWNLNRIAYICEYDD